MTIHDGADASVKSDGLREAAIARVSVHSDNGAVVPTGQNLARPVIYTDALDGWAARSKWSIEWFAQNHGDAFGVIPISFFTDDTSKAVKLRDYIAHLGTAAADTPGFWVDKQKLPLREPPENASEMWAFHWRAFKESPELFDDIGPYPADYPDLAKLLSHDVIDMLKVTTGKDLWSIYISRAGTQTPMHFDYNGTFGSLAQFEGTKHVSLIEPIEGAQNDLTGFDPDHPDLDAFPNMRDRTVYRSALEPGELLIIPPRWWHHVRAQTHSLTLSHNFFTLETLGDFFTGMLRGMVQKDPHVMQAKLVACFPDEGIGGD